MSERTKAKLIARIKRTTVGGKGFQAVILDLSRMYMTGDMTLEEGKAVGKAADEQLRKFNIELKKRRAALRRY